MSLSENRGPSIRNGLIIVGRRGSPLDHIPSTAQSARAGWVMRLSFTGQDDYGVRIFARAANV